MTKTLIEEHNLRADMIAQSYRNSARFERERAVSDSRNRAKHLRRAEAFSAKAAAANKSKI